MDVLNKGYLDSETLLAAFKHNNIYCDEKILKCLMRIFKKRINEKISSADFAKFIEIWLLLSSMNDPEIIFIFTSFKDEGDEFIYFLQMIKSKYKTYTLILQ